MGQRYMDSIAGHPALPVNRTTFNMDLGYGAKDDTIGELDVYHLTGHVDRELTAVIFTHYRFHLALGSSEISGVIYA